jgi:hypothetical protein
MWVPHRPHIIEVYVDDHNYWSEVFKDVCSITWQSWKFPISWPVCSPGWNMSILDFFCVSSYATPLYPQKLTPNFVDKWRSLSRYSSLADYGPRSLFFCLSVVVNRGLQKGTVVVNSTVCKRSKEYSHNVWILFVCYSWELQLCAMNVEALSSASAKEVRMKRVFILTN